jgi:DNA-binding transcriptional regulator/RsmH inhibitor MraZ
MSATHTAWKFETEIDEQGRIVVPTSLPPHAQVTVFVVEAGDDSADLTAAAGSSLDFWDNPLDDEDWNDAGPG